VEGGRNYDARSSSGPDRKDLERGPIDHLRDDGVAVSGLNTVVFIAFGEVVCRTLASSMRRRSADSGGTNQGEVVRS
jgi:hypothetical protein